MLVNPIIGTKNASSRRIKYQTIGTVQNIILGTAQNIRHVCTVQNIILGTVQDIRLGTVQNIRLGTVPKIRLRRVQNVLYRYEREGGVYQPGLQSCFAKGYQS